MSIENLQAVGEYVFIIKDEAATERNGLLLPESSVKKPNIGVIISVGSLVSDPAVQKGKKAVFSKQVGSEIEMFGQEISVLNGNQQLLGIL